MEPILRNPQLSKSIGVKGPKAILFYGPLGSRNGLQYIGKPTVEAHPVFYFAYFSDENEVYYLFRKVYGSLARYFCDKFGVFGLNGNCDESKPSSACDCLKGFNPKSVSEMRFH